MWFARRLAGLESVWGVLVTGKSLIGFSLLSFHGFQFFLGVSGSRVWVKKKARGIMLVGRSWIPRRCEYDGLSNEKRIYVMGNSRWG